MSDKAIYPRAGETRGTASAGDLSEPMARIVRDELSVVRDELRAELRAQSHSRTLKMNAGATAFSAYGTGALAVAVGLLLALVMPGWAAFLIVAAGLFLLALAFRRAARGRRRDRSTRPEAWADPDAPAGTAPPAPAPPAGLTTGPGAGAVPPTAPTAPPMASPDPHAPHHRS